MASTANGWDKSGRGLFMVWEQKRRGKILLFSEANVKDPFTNKANLLMHPVVGKCINISEYYTIKDR